MASGVYYLQIFKFKLVDQLDPHVARGSTWSTFFMQIKLIRVHKNQMWIIICGSSKHADQPKYPSGSTYLQWHKSTRKGNGAYLDGGRWRSSSRQPPQCTSRKPLHDNSGGWRRRGNSSASEEEEEMATRVRKKSRMPNAGEEEEAARRRESEAFFFKIR